MSNARNYDCKAREPAKGSVFEFVLAAQILHDQDGNPSVMDDPVEITHGMSFGARKSAERRNSMIAFWHEETRRQAIEHARRGGVPDNMLIEPFSAATERLVSSVAENIMHCLFITESVADSDGMPTGIRVIPAQVRVLAMARAFAPGLSCQLAAERMNEGAIRRGSNHAGLTRHHMYRASRSFFLSPWTRSRRSLRFALIVAFHQYRAIGRVLDENKHRPEFAGLSGAELASAVHRHFHMPTLIDSAINRGPFVDFKSVDTPKAA